MFSAQSDIPHVVLETGGGCGHECGTNFPRAVGSAVIENALWTTPKLTQKVATKEHSLGTL